MRQNARRRERNRIVRGSMRAVLRAIRNNKSVSGVLETLAWKFKSENDDERLTFAVSKMYSTIDKAYKKGVIHTNKAARHKAQIARWANSISS